MVHTNINDSMIKGPYPDIKKDKAEKKSCGSYQPSHQQPSTKNDKYGSWGPVYKNKQNFVDMHIC